MTPAEKVEMSTEERIAKLEQEVARLSKKLLELERRLAGAASWANLDF